MSRESKDEGKRNWFRGALARLSTLKLSRSSSGRQEMLSPGETSLNIDEFPPPELIENILEKVDDRNTLLRCRLVSQQWYDIITDLLEKRRLSYWTKCWEPELSWDIPYPSQFPAVMILSKSPSKVVKNLRIPSAIDSYSKGNPFPHKSLTIWGTYSKDDTAGGLCFSDSIDATTYGLRFLPFNNCGSFRSEMKWEKLFKKLGHCLTSITLYTIRLKKSRILSMVAHTPNLKALAFYHVIFKHKDIARTGNSQEIVVSPHLAHVQLLHCNPKVAECLLGLCSNQIISLTIVATLFSLPRLRRKKFESLEKLKIMICARPNAVVDWGELLLEADKVPNLKCLTVIDIDLHSLPVKERKPVIKFVSQFHSSLVHLRFNVKLNQLVEHVKETRVVFSNLLSVSLEEAYDGECWEEAPIKKDCFFWFPKLQSVKLTKLIRVDY